MSPCCCGKVYGGSEAARHARVPQNQDMIWIARDVFSLFRQTISDRRLPILAITLSCLRSATLNIRSVAAKWLTGISSAVPEIPRPLWVSAHGRLLFGKGLPVLKRKGFLFFCCN